MSSIGMKRTYATLRVTTTEQAAKQGVAYETYIQELVHEALTL